MTMGEKGAAAKAIAVARARLVAEFLGLVRFQQDRKCAIRRK
jgi:hypothetical protein